MNFSGVTNPTSLTTNFDPSNMSAFGTLEASDLTPVVQGDWVYGINSQIWSVSALSGVGAQVDTNAGRLRIQSGTSAYSFAYLTSKKIVRYRAGQGVTIRITPLFTTGVAGNVQLWGAGSMSPTLSAPVDGYFFGYNGASLGVARYTGGTSFWVPQSAWNGDRVDGSPGTSFAWNPTLGTPAMIKYPYLGYGNIEFFLQNPSTSRWTMAHTIQYANTVNTTQLTNPSLQIVGYTSNTGNTSNITMYSGSVGSFISGQRSFVGSPKWAADSSGVPPLTAAFASKSLVAATELCMINLRNCTIYNGVVNRGALRLNSLSVGTQTNSTNTVVRLHIGATFNGSPSFLPVNGTTADNGVTITNGNSVASADTASTTVTTHGNYIYNITTGPNASQVIDLTPFDIYLNPGETLTVSGQSSGPTSASCSLNWSEDC